MRFIKIAGLLVVLFIMVGIIQLALSVILQVTVPSVPDVVSSILGWIIGIWLAVRAWRAGLGKWVRE